MAAPFVAAQGGQLRPRLQVIQQSLGYGVELIEWSVDDGLNDVEIGAEYSWVKRFRSATIRGQKTSGAAAFASSESWRGRFAGDHEVM